MRESTIPPRKRLARINEVGKLAVDISTDWMQQMFDYEEQGTVEHFERLNKRDQVNKPGYDEDQDCHFCKSCDSEVTNSDRFCWWCGQRLKVDDKKEGETNEID